MFDRLVKHLNSPIIAISVRYVDSETDTELDNSTHTIMTHGALYMLCFIAGLFLSAYLD
jgi:hypothetical protein